MRRGSWSLASRLTRMFAYTTSVLALAITLISAGFLFRSANEQLDGLVREEIDEMEHNFSNATDVRALEGEAQEQLGNHTDNPMAWSIWRPGETEPWATLGKVELLADLPLSSERASWGSMQSFPGDLRGMVRKGQGDHVFGCVVDGSHQLGELRLYTGIAVLLVLATFAILFGVGHLMLSRVASTMRLVAEGARHLDAADQPLQVDLRDAPEEIRELVAALQEMRTNVHAEAERNRVFTASMAHELRSPIQNLMGETEVALMTPRDGVEYRRVLVSHLQELRDLADAVDNLVTICSHNKSATNLMQTRESFDLAPEAKLRLARENNYASARGVQLNIASRGDTRLYGDREGLLRAMRNLTANAIEWSQAGSQVDISVAGENGRVVVTVDDAGPGVPEELKEKIFEAFFRGPQAKGRRIGYGLGLAIVRSAVESQGGQIEVSRSPKGGARFCLLLPRNLHLPPGEDTPSPA